MRQFRPLLQFLYRTILFSIQNRYLVFQCNSKYLHFDGGGRGWGGGGGGGGGGGEKYCLQNFSPGRKISPGAIILGEMPLANFQGGRFHARLGLIPIVSIFIPARINLKLL